MCIKDYKIDVSPWDYHNLEIKVHNEVVALTYSTILLRFIGQQLGRFRWLLKLFEPLFSIERRIQLKNEKPLLGREGQTFLNIVMFHLQTANEYIVNRFTGLDRIEVQHCVAGDRPLRLNTSIHNECKWFEKGSAQYIQICQYIYWKKNLSSGFAV